MLLLAASPTARNKRMLLVVDAQQHGWGCSQPVPSKDGYQNPALRDIPILDFLANDEGRKQLGSLSNTDI